MLPFHPFHGTETSQTIQLTGLGVGCVQHKQGVGLWAFPQTAGTETARGRSLLERSESGTYLLKGGTFILKEGTCILKTPVSVVLNNLSTFHMKLIQVVLKLITYRFN